MSRWLPTLLGFGALSLPELDTLDPLPHAVLVGAYFAYVAFVTVLVIIPMSPCLDTDFPDVSVRQMTASVVPVPAGVPAQATPATATWRAEPLAQRRRWSWAADQ